MLLRRRWGLYIAPSFFFPSVEFLLTRRGGWGSNADSVVFDEKDQKDYFVKPHSFSEDFSLFLEYLQTPRSEDQPVRYAQSRKPLCPVDSLFFSRV